MGNKSEPRTSNRVTILHISDLGINKETNVDELWQSLEIDIVNTYSKDKEKLNGKEKLLKNPDLVIVSGDLTHNGISLEYNILFEFLQKMVKNIFPKLENGERRKRLVIVPGNHDINRDQSKACYTIADPEDFKSCFRKSREIKTEYAIGPNEDWSGVNLFIRKGEGFSEYNARVQDFENFLGRWYGKFEDSSTFYFKEKHEESYKVYEYTPTLPIVIIGFNSCFYIDHLQKPAEVHFSSIEESIKEIRDTNALRIAVWHHGLYPTTPMSGDFIHEHILNILAANDFSLLGMVP